MSVEEIWILHFGQVAERIVYFELPADTLTEQMEQRLMAIENGLNGIIGRLDELQKNLLSLGATIKESSRDCM